MPAVVLLVSVPFELLRPQADRNNAAHTATTTNRFIEVLPPDDFDGSATVAPAGPGRGARQEPDIRRMCRVTSDP